MAPIIAMTLKSLSTLASLGPSGERPQADFFYSDMNKTSSCASRAACQNVFFFSWQETVRPLNNYVDYIINAVQELHG